MILISWLQVHFDDCRVDFLEKKWPTCKPFADHNLQNSPATKLVSCSFFGGTLPPASQAGKSTMNGLGLLVKRLAMSCTGCLPVLVIVLAELGEESSIRTSAA